MSYAALRLLLAVFLAVPLQVAVAAAPTAPDGNSQSSEDLASRTRLIWTSPTTGGVPAYGIEEDAVVVERFPETGQQPITEALDTATGRRLWESHGASPIRGTPLFLAADGAVERIAPRTGVVAWRSKALCKAPARPSYVSVIEDVVYVGCSLTGTLFALHASTGRIVAHADPAGLDEYDQIIPLGRNKLAVSGVASGAHTYRQSAILSRMTLATLIKFQDASILGEQNGEAIVADTCCEGTNTDSAPAVLERISLQTGAVVNSVQLHPYAHELPADRDLPGAGPLHLVGDRLYVATHTALFLYDVSRLAAPRILYDDLAGGVSFLANNYAIIVIKPVGGTRKVAAVDLSEAVPRVIWSSSSAPWVPVPWQPEQGPTIEIQANAFGKQAAELIHIKNGKMTEFHTGCDLATSDAGYILTLCEDPRRYEMYLAD